MDLDQLGNLGEFVSGVAVVASLIYVAIQIRQNTRATQAATLQEVSRDMREQFSPKPLEHEASRKISCGEKLTFEERWAWNQYTMNTFRMYENQWFQYRQGALDAQLFRGYQNHIYLTMDLPGAEAFWESTRTAFFHPEFVTHVEELLKTRPDLPNTRLGTAAPNDAEEPRD
jgi:hypothetical protein